MAFGHTWLERYSPLTHAKPYFPIVITNEVRDLFSFP
jgi:hypothetical protein